MASITRYATAAGTRWRVRYRKPNRAQTTKRGFLTKRDAELFAASIEVAKASGLYIDPSLGRTTVRELAEVWKVGRLAARKRSTQVVMETSWRVHVEPEWGFRRFDSIRSSEVEAWMGKLLATRAPQTVRRAIFVLGILTKMAVRDGIITRDPLAGIELPKKTLKPPVYLSHRQVGALASAAGKAASDDEEVLTQTLSYTGMRWGEATALRIKHRDRVRRQFLVEDNVVRVAGELVTGTPKNGESRWVPYPAFLNPLLDALSIGKGSEHYLFGAGFVPLPRAHATSGWFVRAVRACREADETFPLITPHDLRHTAASLAISAGANVKAIQRMLGHSSAAVTLDIYGHLFDDDLTKVAKALDKARLRAVG